MFFTVYKITNKIDGKIYIGTHKTNDLNDGYMGSGKYLLNAQQKHGLENFEKEIMFIYDNSKDMFKKEAELVDEIFLKSENTYNIKLGGFGGFDHINSTGKNLYGFPNLIKGWIKERTPEENKKRSETLKYKYRSGILPHPWKGRKHSEETKKLISEKVKASKSKKPLSVNGKPTVL